MPRNQGPRKKSGKPRRKSVKQLVREARSHEPTAAIEELVRRYSGTINFHAKNALTANVDCELEELEARGIQGLLNAIMGYNMNTVQFRTWASQCIRGAITPLAGCGMNDPLSLSTTADSEDSEGAVVVASTCADTVEEAERAEIWGLVRKLPLMQRLAVYLVYKHGNTLRSAGDLLGFSHNGVNLFLKAGLKNIREMLNHEAA